MIVASVEKKYDQIMLAMNFQKKRADLPRMKSSTFGPPYPIATSRNSLSATTHKTKPIATHARARICVIRGPALNDTHQGRGPQNSAPKGMYFYMN